MRIGVNCLRIYPSYKGGTNSFTLGLLDGFARVGEEHEFKVFVTPWNRAMFERFEGVPNLELVEIDESEHRWLRRLHRFLPLAVKNRLPVEAPNRVFNSRVADLLAREVDVMYVPYVPPPRLFPFPDVPTVYSIHDIQQVHFPEFFTPEEHSEREASFAKCVDHATVIQASSRYMAQDFCDHFPKLNESNVEVIPEGVDVELFSHDPLEDDVLDRYGLPASFLFTPAQLWHHKNHITILKALGRLRERGLVLPWVLTGAEYNAAEGIFEFVRANGLEDQVYYLGVVPFEDVIALHHRARFLVTASLYESSSLPVLEAAAAGTPIVAGSIPPHEEMAEHLEMRLFPPTDDAELARALQEAWTDDKTSRAQAEANREGVQRYSWDNAARMYLRLFERLQARESVLAGGRS
ncbi:MAG TPA: glycosyltransferase family 1 protein [Gaiellaceae bacterium]|nr:glycosyltransferase family 1 protein [Gaiellaceae bacterium]